MSSDSKTPILVKLLDRRSANVNSKSKSRFGLYICPLCDTQFEANVPNVKKGLIKSCGCYRRTKQGYIDGFKITTFKGGSSHRLYEIWRTMIVRCYNINRKDYKYYGERGIKVDSRWASFENFINDMYPTFKEGLTLDRVDNNKGYSKENCRWATKTMQSRNRRNIVNKMTL